MNDDELLAEKARAAIHKGKLPNRAPDQTWGGPGTGARCRICGAAVKTDETELEIEFAQDSEGSAVDRYQMHVRCFAVWERERHSLAPPVPAAATRKKTGRSHLRPEADGRFLLDAVGEGNILAGGREGNLERGPE